MIDRPADNGHRSHPGVLLVSSPAAQPTVLLEERPAAPPTVVVEERPAAPSVVVTCSERLPRDVLVRLGALSCQVDRIRQGTAAHSDLSVRLDELTAGLNALVQSIYDETVLHFAGRRA